MSCAVARTRWLRGLSPYSCPLAADEDGSKAHGVCGYIVDYDGGEGL